MDHEIRDILEKYGRRMPEYSSNHFYRRNEIPPNALRNAREKYAEDVKVTHIIGMIDTTVRGNGKTGYIFTDEKMYWRETMGDGEELSYEDITDVELGDDIPDNENWIEISLKDGDSYYIEEKLINKKPLYHFLTEVKEHLAEKKAAKKARKAQLEQLAQEPAERADEVDGNLMEASGLAAGFVPNTQSVYEESKFHARQGSGFAAERMNDMFDRLTGHSAEILGDDNQKHGADRRVDGNLIQTKYCKTGGKCIEACFENGKFVYMDANGQPMQIEVPSDKYQGALKAMEKRIAKGEVPGVTDTNEAKNIVRKGHFTYQQAVNVAKAGTVESIVYDSAQGAVIATQTIGISAVMTFACAIWNGDDPGAALNMAVQSGLKVGGVAFATHVLVGQATKAGAEQLFEKSAENIVKKLGPNGARLLARAYGKESAGMAAGTVESHAQKLLEGNMLTATITIAVLSAKDFANAFQGKISGQQLFKNITNVTASVGGGIAGAAVGSVVPGVGTLIGAGVGSYIAGKASKKVTDVLVEDDVVRLTKIIEKKFAQLATEYLLTQKEADIVLEDLNMCLNAKTFQEMQAQFDQEYYAEELIRSYIEEEIKEREVIKLPADAAWQNCVAETLEQLAQQAEA